MKKNQTGNKVKNGSTTTTHNANRFIPTSLKFISSCIKTVSSNVRSASASFAGDSDDIHKDQVLWACFDRLELGISNVKRVLLLGYSNGFQVLDVEDASNISELVSRRDDPVTFLQIQPFPFKFGGVQGYRKSHPLLVVVASDGASLSSPMQNERDGSVEPHMSSLVHCPTAVRFYSFSSHNYVHVLRFRSAIYMVRCSPRVVAVGLAAQIYCFDAITLENKFSVLTYPVPQLGSQGSLGINIGYGPMAVGPRWLAYSPRNPLSSNTGRLSPQSLTPPGVSPSTSPGSGSLVARYAMESSKQLATGLINLGDIGYKTLSKYCHERLPDGSSSPVASSSNWKVSRFASHSAETDTAGMVVIKDFISSCVISQFRAHTSPISALCFDPSGTLLVTASIHGNNINIFRIMPNCSQNGSSNYSYDWTSSYVHLYKLHRGMTPAVIQDICFSPYSQWIAIVSSRGTFHIFVLSSLGGETGLQIHNSRVYRPILLPVHSGPRWSTSSFMTNQSSVCPSSPATVTLSAVSRIRNGNSWWINTVSNAASSAAGKATVSSGVFAAVFNSFVNKNLQPGSSNINALEHMLVYTPSGNVIQYELHPSVEGEQGESSLRTGTSSLVHIQEEDLQVKAEPVRWWDVCRRADWPEREEFILRFPLARQEAAETDMDASGCEDNEIGKKNCSVKPNEQLHYYLSNAEVQVQSGRIPIWQKSKICFYMMIPREYDEVSRSEDFFGGEFEIEKIPVHEVEVRRRELLPVFDCYHHISPTWSDDSGIEKERNSAPSSDFHGGKESFSEDILASHAKLISPGLVDNYLDIVSPRTSEVNDVDQMGTLKSCPSTGLIPNENCRVQTSSIILASFPVNQRTYRRVDTSVSPQLSANVASSFEESCIKNDNSSIPKITQISNARIVAGEAKSSNSVVTSDSSNTSSNRSDISMNIIDEGTVHEDMEDPLDYGPYFQEEYCKAPTSDGTGESTEIVTDVDSNSSPHEKEKLEDGDADDILGGVFEFSEEG